MPFRQQETSLGEILNSVTRGGQRRSHPIRATINGLQGGKRPTEDGRWPKSAGAASKTAFLKLSAKQRWLVIVQASIKAQEITR